jgi:hypothetical protein
VKTAKENNAFILVIYFPEVHIKIMYDVNNILPAIPMTEKSKKVKVCSSQPIKHQDVRSTGTQVRF